VAAGRRVGVTERIPGNEAATRVAARSACMVMAGVYGCKAPKSHFLPE
jgi:hypothetical protein